MLIVEYCRDQIEKCRCSHFSIAPSSTLHSPDTHAQHTKTHTALLSLSHLPLLPFSLSPHTQTQTTPPCSSSQRHNNNEKNKHFFPLPLVCLFVCLFFFASQSFHFLCHSFTLSHYFSQETTPNCHFLLHFPFSTFFSFCFGIFFFFGWGGKKN